MLMSDSLGGIAKTLMFLDVSPTDSNMDETNVRLLPALRTVQAAAGFSCRPRPPAPLCRLCSAGRQGERAGASRLSAHIWQPMRDAWQEAGSHAVAAGCGR